MKAYKASIIKMDYPSAMIRCKTSISEDGYYVITDMKPSGFYDKSGKAKLHITIEQVELIDDGG